MSKRYTPEERESIIRRVDALVKSGRSIRQACEDAGAPYSGYRYWKDRGLTETKTFPQAIPRKPVIEEERSETYDVNTLQIVDVGQGAALVGPRSILEKLLAIFKASQATAKGTPERDGRDRIPS